MWAECFYKVSLLIRFVLTLFFFLFLTFIPFSLTLLCLCLSFSHRNTHIFHTLCNHDQGVHSLKCSSSKTSNWTTHLPGKSYTLTLMFKLWLSCLLIFLSFILSTLCSFVLFLSFTRIIVVELLLTYIINFPLSHTSKWLLICIIFSIRKLQRKNFGKTCHVEQTSKRKPASL